MTYLFGFVILLGVLIFIHELGHFLIAKACGVRVDTFSIGMGYKFLRFKRGETEYALSVLPVGGYVKMLGQDPREEVPPGEENKSFRHKPLWKRASIVLAGPFFNAALAALVLTALYAHGVSSPAPELARVLPDSAAAKVGFRSGDKVAGLRTLSGTAYRIDELSDLEGALDGAVGKSSVITVDRGGTRTDIPYTPVLGLTRDSTIGVIRDRGVIEGVEYRAPGPVIAVTSASWAGRRQVPSKLWIEQVTYERNGHSETVPTENWDQVTQAWNRAVAAQPGSSGRFQLKGYPILAENDKSTPTPVELPIAWTSAKDRPPMAIEEAGIHSAELVISEVKSGTPADKLGLKEGDRLETLNGQRILSFTSFRADVQRLAGNGQVLRLGWSRDGKKLDAEIKPEKVEARDPLTEAKKNQFQIGAAFLALPAFATMTVVQAHGPVDAVVLGVDRAYRLTVSMLSSFVMLARGDISPKTLGGPILIGKIAGESLKQGSAAFLRMMAFISLNLFILNLLPIPVLDGGHLVLYCIEALRRRPLNIKIVEAWTTAGFFLLMSLVAVVFFNDLSRLGLFKFLNL